MLVVQKYGLDNGWKATFKRNESNCQLLIEDLLCVFLIKIPYAKYSSGCISNTKKKYIKILGNMFNKILKNRLKQNTGRKCYHVSIWNRRGHSNP
jgi:hypothetical protein